MTVPSPQICLAADSFDRTNVADWLSFLFSWGLPFTLYLVLQIISLFRIQGIWRRLALLPIPIMAYVVYVSVVASKQGSNIWPLLLILVSPVAVLFLLFLLLLCGFARSASRRGADEEEVRL